jgi:signal transduction histidine kinase
MRQAFRDWPIRRKLLLMVLLPLAVVLPALGVVLLLWSNVAIDGLLITKVRSDLAVANGYFERVRGEVGAGTEAVAQSHALHSALDAGDDDALPPLLQRVKERAGLDFLLWVHPDGTIAAADWGRPARPQRALPVPDATPEAAPEATPEAARKASRPDSGASARHPAAGVELLDGARLAAMAPALVERLAIPLLPTRNAAPTERAVEGRALALLAQAPVHGADGRLLGRVQGGVLLNRNLAVIDHINEIVYPAGSLPFGSQGTATIFLDDVRVTTNVRLFGPQGESRAIGTRVSKSVREAVLGRGQTWLDRAFVVDDWYVSGYQPLVDRTGRRVGMLYVGFLERPYAWVKYAALAGIGALYFAVMVGAAWFSLRLARGIFKPLERMSATMRAVEGGDAGARVGPQPAADEIGTLAGHLDQLLDSVDEKARALQRWGEELDRKVAERTAELAERTRDLEASHARLRLAQDQLVKNEKLAAIGQLTASIAHEVNNPIAVIQGNLDLLRELLGAAAAPASAEIQLIDEQIDRMRLIVTQLLQFARPTEYAGYVETVDPREAIDASLVLVGHLLAKTRIRVERDDRARRGAGINRQELQQVLINLLVNAIQAMPEGGTLRLATGDWEPAEAGEAGGVVIEVADSGPGLDDAVLARLFQPFETHKREGTGLGLWISRNLIERYGGELTGANRRDAPQGAVFTIRLRSEPRPPEEAGRPLGGPRTQ